MNNTEKIYSMNKKADIVSSAFPNKRFQNLF